MCSRKPGQTKYSKIKSVLGEYIRGRKKMEDIVHPSKITRISKYSPVRRSFHKHSCDTNLITKSAPVDNFSSDAVSSPKKRKASENYCLEKHCLEQTEKDTKIRLGNSNIDVHNGLRVINNGDKDSISPKNFSNSHSDTNPDTANSKAARKAYFRKQESDSDEGQFDEDMLIKLKLKDSVEIHNDNTHPHDHELGLLIQSSNRHLFSQMVLENQNLKLSVQPLKNERVTSNLKNSVDLMSSDNEGQYSSNSDHQLQLVLRDMRDCINQMKLSHNLCPGFKTESNETCQEFQARGDENNENHLSSCIQSKSHDPGVLEVHNFTMEVPAEASQCKRDLKRQCQSTVCFQDSDCSQKLNELDRTHVFSDSDLKQLKTDLYYYKEKVEHERIQLADLQNEVAEAEGVLQEYEITKHQFNEENAYFKKDDFEALLKEFLNSESYSLSSNADVADVSLHCLIADYFRKYYDNLSKKVNKFDQERGFLSIMCENMTKDHQNMRNLISQLKYKLAGSMKHS